MLCDFENIQINWRWRFCEAEHFSRLSSDDSQDLSLTRWINLIQSRENFYVNWVLLLRFAVHFNCHRCISFSYQRTEAEIKGERERNFAEKSHEIWLCFIWENEVKEQWRKSEGIWNKTVFISEIIVFVYIWIIVRSIFSSVSSLLHPFLHS